MKTFFRELEKILAQMDGAQRARAAEVLRSFIHGLSNFKDALPGLSMKAWTMLIGDLTMYMSMNKKGPAVWAKAKEVAGAIGPHVAALVQDIGDVHAQ